MGQKLRRLVFPLTHAAGYARCRVLSPALSVFDFFALNFFFKGWKNKADEALPAA
jgi:hypothetical protein